MKIRKDDKVKVLTGKDKGKTGKVLQVFPVQKKASVEGINLMIKNIRSQKQGEKGQKVQFPAPIPTSNLIVVCPKCSKPARIGFKILDNKKKVRVCKKCSENL